MPEDFTEAKSMTEKIQRNLIRRQCKNIDEEALSGDIIFVFSCLVFAFTSTYFCEVDPAAQ